ncbi:MAG: hypothetical protein GY711_01600 [bacterium]|nr:hypothetical protein [bacterium]
MYVAAEGYRPERLAVDAKPGPNDFVAELAAVTPAYIEIVLDGFDSVGNVEVDVAANDTKTVSVAMVRAN